MITVIMLAKNEAQNLSEVLPQLTWADEVIVIDDDSTDETVAVCKRFGVRVLTRPLANDFAAQRNFGLSQVKSGWVLFLDSDERLSPKAVKEIKEVVSHEGNRAEAFSFRRIDYFLGKPLQFGETGSIWLTRLGKVGAGIFEGKVHEVWNIPSAQHLDGTMSHYSHSSVSQLFHTVARYADVRAQELYNQGKYWNAFEQVTYPIAKFIYTFILRWGFLDGWRGFVMSTAMSWHSWLVRWQLWRLAWLKRRTADKVNRILLVIPWLLLPLGQLMRLELPAGGAVYVFELVMLLAVVGFGLTQIKDLTKGDNPPWMRPLIIFSLVLGVSWITSPFLGSNVTSILYWSRWLLYGSFLWAIWKTKQSNRLLVSIPGLIEYVGFGLLLGGVLQFIVMPDMRWLYQYGWDDHYYRMIGTLFDPNYFGLLALLIGWWWFQNEAGVRRYVGVAVASFCVIATYSRTAYLLGGLLFLIEFIRSSRSWKTMTLILSLLVLLYIALPKPGGEGVNLWRLYSITSRTESWQQAAVWIQKYPIMGIGYNYYPVVQRAGTIGLPYHPSAPDSSWLLVLVTSGVIGLISFLYLIASWWKGLPFGWVKVSLVMILLHALTNNSFFYPWVLLWWWLLILQSDKVNG